MNRVIVAAQPIRQVHDSLAFQIVDAQRRSIAQGEPIHPYRRNDTRGVEEAQPVVAGKMKTVGVVHRHRQQAPVRLDDAFGNTGRPGGIDEAGGRIGCDDGALRRARKGVRTQVDVDRAQTVAGGDNLIGHTRRLGGRFDHAQVLRRVCLGIPAKLPLCILEHLSLVGEDMKLGHYVKTGDLGVDRLG